MMMVVMVVMRVVTMVVYNVGRPSLFLLLHVHKKVWHHMYVCAVDKSSGTRIYAFNRVNTTDYGNSQLFRNLEMYARHIFILKVG